MSLVTIISRGNYLVAAIIALCISGCFGDPPKISATYNESASLIGDLPANPLQWQVIAAAINHAESSMATLYGNDVAVHYARTNGQHNYPPNSILALVTWAQQDDPRYFGARIPSQVKSVEFVFVKAGGNGAPQYSYQEYEGSPLKRGTVGEGPTLNDRAAYLLAQRAAVMP
jgi:hypothetical protein